MNTIARETWMNPANGEIVADFGDNMVAIRWASDYFGIYAIDPEAETEKSAMLVSQCLYKPKSGETYAEAAHAIYYR